MSCLFQHGWCINLLPCNNASWVQQNADPQPPLWLSTHDDVVPHPAHVLPFIWRFLVKKICICPTVWIRHCPDVFPKSSWAKTHKSWSGPLWCGHQESSLPSSITSLKRVKIVARSGKTLQPPSGRDIFSYRFKPLASHQVDEQQLQDQIPTRWWIYVKLLNLVKSNVSHSKAMSLRSVSKDARKMLFMAVALLTKSTPCGRDLF